MEKVKEDGTLLNPYSNFIAVSRYARWSDDKARRETWTETVDRYVDYMSSKIDIDDATKEEIREAITNHKAMPSMRALMTAGPALDRESIAGYNCSFVAVDNLRAFDETVYILMNGTGVGFSVESRHVNKLPVIAEEFSDTETTIVVEDSKQGWAKAYKELIALLVQGLVPKWDMSKVRPAGARLKTFGGRASGPAPLEGLFKFTIDTFKKAAGRKLKPIECHDIMCKIGDIVVVGGVRRSALISQSDLDDFEMASAKSGRWFEANGHRALANNSAVYHEKPTMGQFLAEWKNLYDSKSGERGIINMGSIRKHVDSFGRRDSELIEGVNPCFAADSLLLNSDGWVSFGQAYADGNDQKIIQDGRVTYVQSEDGSELPENWKVSGDFSEGVVTDASRVFLTQENANIVKLNTASGLSVRLTPDHLVATPNGMVEAQSLSEGDKVLVVTAPKANSIVGRGPKTLEEHEAMLMGLIAGDGTFAAGKVTEQARICLWGDDANILDKVTESIMFVWEKTDVQSCGNRPFVPYNVVMQGDKVTVGSSFLAAHLKKKYGFERKTKHIVPHVLLRNARHTPALFYVAALAFCDGTVNKYNKVGSSSIRISQSNRDMLRNVNLILIANGIVPKLYLRREESDKIMPDGHGGHAMYHTKANYESVIMTHAFEFATRVGFLWSKKQELAESVFTHQSRKKNIYDTVVSVFDDGIEDVYCLKEDTRRTLVAGGITMRRCGEILLRNNQQCNLSEVVIEPNDTKEDLKNKVRLATIIGTYQSTLTNFKYVRKAWKKNCEEERLLGVSLTGIFGNRLTNGSLPGLEDLLDELREYAVEVNAEWAKKFGINPSTAVTCVKPSGTVSQLVGVSSGIHPWYAPYYLRSVRGDNKDPLTKLMKDEGFPHEPDKTKPDDITVFYFPIKAPEGAVVTKDLTAIEHLNIWKTYREHWTEHNPSVTINVREHEWVEVGSWVYENFDAIGGVSFLPMIEHTYEQAPYQEITEQEYNDYLAKMPADIGWESLSLYELTDMTAGSQELACSAAGGCEIVDIV